MESTINGYFTLDNVHGANDRIIEFMDQLSLPQVYRQPGEPLFSTFQFESPEENRTIQFILTATDANVSDVKIELDNSCEIVLPLQINAGETAKYVGGEKVFILNAFLHKIKEINMDKSLLQISKGKHSINFDCVFSEKGKEPSTKFEVRIAGKAEKVKANR